MNLHNNKKLFGETIRAASQYSGVRATLMEKDYWITFVLSQLSESQYAGRTVFKGGTSLSKGYELIHRFSEDVDIAVIGGENQSANEIKALIRAAEKEMTAGLKEKNVEGVTSKGSRFRKAFFEYESIDRANVSNTLIVEINSFANPFPFQLLSVKSFLHDFLARMGNEAMIEIFGLQPFRINVLAKEQTLMEKLVSLIRFSFDADPRESLASKIRHFYDLYYLVNDPECATFVKSVEFRKRFEELLQHDRDLFEVPSGWGDKSLHESPLFANFDSLWKQLKDVYKRELSALAFMPIPAENQVAEQFKKLLKNIPLS